MVIFLKIVNYSNKLGIKSIFYIRTNLKLYACPIKNIDNNKRYKNICEKYVIQAKLDGCSCLFIKSVDGIKF